MKVVEKKLCRRYGMKKYEMITQYVAYTAREITQNEENWKKYLTTASKLYKYPFKDQLLIYAQRPDATACATMEIWNKKMFCWINRNAKGIALLDEKSDTRLKYVFDVSDVHRGGRGSSLPYLWNMEKEHQKVVLERLEALYGSTNKKLAFSKRIQELAERIAENVSETLANDLEKIKKGSTLEYQSEKTTQEEFHQTLSNSIAYSILKRCSIAENVLKKTIEFPYIHHFDTMQTLSQLGTNVSDLTKPILVEIGKVIMEYDKTHTRNKKSVAEKLKPKRTQETQKKSIRKNVIEVQETSIPKNEKEKEPFLNSTTSTKNPSVLNEDEYIRNHFISNENAQEDNSKENENFLIPNHSHLQNEITSNIPIELSKSIQTEQREVSASNEHENQTSSTEMKQSLEKNEVSPITHQKEEGEVSDKIAEMLLVMKICQELGRSAVVDWNETTQSVIIKNGEGTVEGKEAYEILFSEAADYIIDQTYDGYVQKGLDMADWMKELGKYTSRYYKQEMVSEQIGIKKAPTNKISIKEKLSEKKAEITKRENSTLKEKTTKRIENVL